MDVVKMDTSNNNNKLTILVLAALSIILLPVLQTKAYAFDFGNETVYQMLPLHLQMDTMVLMRIILLSLVCSKTTSFPH